MPATVAATAVPTTRAPITWKTAAQRTAGAGRMARVTMGAAMALPASWTPLATANIPESTTTTTITALILSWPGRGRTRKLPMSRPSKSTPRGYDS